MNRPQHDSNERLDARVTDLEELHTHFERLLSDLSGVLVSLQKRVDTLEMRLESTSKHIEQSLDSRQEERTLEDDRPPHY